MGNLTESSQISRDIDLSPGQPLQSSQPSGSLGVIGRRSVADLGAIGDFISVSTPNSGGMHDQLYNLQMLESAFYRLPQPKDSERAKTYAPVLANSFSTLFTELFMHIFLVTICLVVLQRHPAVTPSSYPQVQAPIVSNPAFWERLGADNYGTDTLFFAFYYQQVG